MSGPRGKLSTLRVQVVASIGDSEIQRYRERLQAASEARRELVKRLEEIRAET